ncbi:MAG: MlaD family protein [Gemmatimonadota bacterium]|jgi:phospholipid/cholesterol/gamma-HCH transport system substrate-binding protein
MTPTNPGSGPSDAEIRAATPRDRGASHIRVGIFVLLGLVSFITVLFLLTEPAMFRGRYNLITQLSDAGGVRRGDPVQMRGVIIGRVSSFEMTPDRRVNVGLELYDEWRIPEGSVAVLAESGLFGGRTVEVQPGDGPGFLAAGDTILGEDPGGGLMENAGVLGEQATNLMARMETLLDSSTVASVQGTTQEVLVLAREFRATVEEQRQELSQLTRSLNRTASGLEGAADAGSDVASAAARADSLLAELTLTQGRLDDVLANLDTVIGRVARGEGTLGRLSQDETLYTNMDQTLVSLNQLLVDLRENPGRYLTVEIF